MGAQFGLPMHPARAQYQTLISNTEKGKLKPDNILFDVKVRIEIHFHTDTCNMHASFNSKDLIHYSETPYSIPSIPNGIVGLGGCDTQTE